MPEISAELRQQAGTQAVVVATFIEDLIERAKGDKGFAFVLWVAERMATMSAGLAPIVGTPEGKAVLAGELWDVFTGVETTAIVNVPGVDPAAGEEFADGIKALIEALILKASAPETPTT